MESAPSKRKVSYLENGEYRPTISIIGAGIGGLGAALSLQNHGFAVKVYERDACFHDRRQGFGLTLTNNSKGPLAKLGILSDCIKEDCASNSHWVFSPNGEILGYYGRKFINYEKKETAGNSGSGDKHRGNLRIPRQNLRKMLLDRLLPDTVQWGYKLETFEESVDNVKLIFSNSVNNQREEILTDILIGADGIRSVVRRIRDDIDQQNDTVFPLKYLGVSVILGLSTLKHPLINQRGFYVLDGVNRLFTMPFQEEDLASKKQQLTMWQLSFSDIDEASATKFKTANPSQLLEKALEKTEKWMSPVAEMIASTKLDEVWGTAIYDRDGMNVYSNKRQGKGKLPPYKSRVTILGDGCHPQSMFKGFGANQALEDGPLISMWLSKPGLTNDNIYTRLRSFEREMVGRTTPKVLASRSAAKRLHSTDVMSDDFGIEGLSDDTTKRLLSHFKANNITINSVEDMEEYVVKFLATQPV
jgi:2-polyprenyl-6-methoxyphenol hydroxylase-like FAD-dependent oxidoreductase